VPPEVRWDGWHVRESQTGSIFFRAFGPTLKEGVHGTPYKTCGPQYCHPGLDPGPVIPDTDPGLVARDLIRAKNFCSIFDFCVTYRHREASSYRHDILFSGFLRQRNAKLPQIK
jgi:hypothetical protein